MRIAVIPGDGIGKDVTAEAVKVVRAVANASAKTIDLQHLPWSADHYLATGETLPADGYRMLRDDFAAIFVGALVHELRRRGGGLGVAAICSGGGQGDAIVLEVNGN